MKITFLIRSLDLGGAQRQLVSLARGLHERGHRVLIATFYGGGPLEEELAGIPVRDLGKKGRWDLLGFLTRLVRLVREEKPDILHGYLAIPNILTVLLKPLFPRTRMVWGTRNAKLYFDRYDRVRRLAYRVERLLSRFADLIIANSYRGRDYAADYGFPEDKIVVIPNGIDTERFHPDLEARRRLRAEWGVAEDEKLVGLVGRLAPMKDHATFLEAAALLARERRDVRYVCVGEGPAGYRQELRALSARLGLKERLLWAGARKDMPAVHNALDVAASSSYDGEGFPNVVGEAMACGVPCVVTDVGDSARVVGETGVVVPPGDPRALAEGLKAASNGRVDPRSLRERVVRCFSTRALVLNTEETLRGIIKH